jgi:hypothetical protein
MCYGLAVEVMNIAKYGYPWKSQTKAKIAKWRKRVADHTVDADCEPKSNQGT